VPHIQVNAAIANADDFKDKNKIKKKPLLEQCIAKP
jgi:hypothetical protein